MDVATGTGIIAIAAAQIVGSHGKVIGVDFSSGMLTQAQQKIETLGLQNIELIEADAEYIDFNNESFDIILCSTAIVYFKDIPAALSKWYRFLKSGGFVGFSCCSEESCDAPLIIGACAKYGISLISINEQTGTLQKCQSLLKEAGFKTLKLSPSNWVFTAVLNKLENGMEDGFILEKILYHSCRRSKWNN